MGGPMATNFLKTNHKVVVYDVGTDATNHLTTAGAEVTTNGLIFFSLENLWWQMFKIYRYINIHRKD